MLIYEIGLLVGHYKDSYQCMKKYQLICQALKASPDLAMEVLTETTEAGKELNNLLKIAGSNLKGLKDRKDWGDKKEWR